EMEDRKRRFDDLTDVKNKLEETIRRVFAANTFIDGVHVFTKHDDVPDDSLLRLVILQPDQWFSREEKQVAERAVLEYVKQNGNKPRHRGNRLLFIAPDLSITTRMKEAVRTQLAWESIVEDVRTGRLVIDTVQKNQADQELQTATQVVLRVVRECYKWLLCPAQAEPTSTKIEVESYSLNVSGNAAANEVERVCLENELVIKVWSPIHLREKLRQVYWRGETSAIPAKTFWEDTLRYIYLPRLRNRDVLNMAIRNGSSSRDFFGTAEGLFNGKFEGFRFGEPVAQVTETLLIIEPAKAKKYQEEQKQTEQGPDGNGSGGNSGRPPGGITGPGGNTGTGGNSGGNKGGGGTSVKPESVPAKKSYFGAANLNAATAKMQMISIADEVIAHLVKDPHARVSIRVEISAEFPEGAKEEARRVVSANAESLRFEHTE
ncbi:MAG: hypothetical protein ACKO0V_16800, partial [bacterium]